MTKLRIQTCSEDDSEDNFPTSSNIDLIHSGEISAFTPVKSKNVNVQQLNEFRNQRKDAFQSIKGLFKTGVKICPCSTLKK
jgi:hypothetical protein